MRNLSTNLTNIRLQNVGAYLVFPTAESPRRIIFNLSSFVSVILVVIKYFIK